MHSRSSDPPARKKAQGPDETSPLIPQIFVVEPDGLLVDRQQSERAEEKEISSSKLKYIMASVWIGTFCAGLGEYPPLRC